MSQRLRERIERYQDLLCQHSILEVFYNVDSIKPVIWDVNHTKRCLFWRRCFLSVCLRLPSTFAGLDRSIVNLRVCPSTVITIRFDQSTSRKRKS